MHDQRTAGDLAFEHYLRDIGAGVPVHEQPLPETAKRPDYVVEIDGLYCICEVKEFSREAHPPSPNRTGSRGMSDVLAPIRGQIREAARKLKDLQHLGLPLVIVLVNAQDAFVDVNSDTVAFAMQGDPTAIVPIHRALDAPARDWSMVAGRNGRLARDHQYVSGVAVLVGHSRQYDWVRGRRHLFEHLPRRQRMLAIVEDIEAHDQPTGSYFSADLICASSPTAVPIPDAFFSGPKDRRWDYRDGDLVQVRGPVDE